MVSSAKCLACAAGVIVMASCHGELPVSPRGSQTFVPDGKAPASFGVSHTASYPDAKDYVEVELRAASAKPPVAQSVPEVPSAAPVSRRSESNGVGRYTVVRGDTLCGIGRRYGLTAASIKSANGLKSDLIHPGEVLAIPQRAASGDLRKAEPSRTVLSR